MLPKLAQKPVNSEMDSLNVDDIVGTRPHHRVRFTADSLASKEVIEGSFPGWRPAHRRRFGKSVRDLCLQVQDINRPTRRMLRSGNAEAYLEIEGTHPKHLKQFQIGNVRSNHSLQAFDIQGTESGSATWISNIQRKKDEGKERTCTLKQQELAELVAEGLLDAKTQGSSCKCCNLFADFRLCLSLFSITLSIMVVDLSPL
ncbi:hypothetical protein L7F22_016254 [Adiantum nelumboides]|nr:hypothetical protein [Adiantum nelumboides]